MKKLVSLLMAVVLMIGMSSTALAARKGWKIDSINEDTFIIDVDLKHAGIPWEDYWDFIESGYTELHLGTIEPGEELTIYTESWCFYWEGPDGEIYDWWDYYWDDEEGKWETAPWLSNMDLRKAGLTFGTQSAVANKTTNGQRFTPTTRGTWYGGKVKIPFVEKLVSTEEQDFEFVFYYKLKDRPTRHEIRVTGTIANPEIPAYASYDRIDLSEGYIAEAMEHIENIEVDLGNGVSVFTKMFKGKKYYGHTERLVDEKDDVVLKLYPDIDNILHLDTVGLNSTGDVVKLSTDYAKYHVYDKDFRYLGMADEMLPFSATYYLANKQLDSAMDDLNDNDEVEQDEQESEE